MIRDASLEVRGPVIYATAVVIAVFLPELFTTSVQGHFVGPAGAGLHLRGAGLAARGDDLDAGAVRAAAARSTTPVAEAALAGAAEGLAGRARSTVSAQHFKAVAVLVLLLVLAALAALPFLGGTFMPDFREGHFVMQVSSSTPGTSLDEMLAVGKRISADVLALPYVAHHRAADRPRRAGRGHLGAASQRIPRRAEARCRPSTRVEAQDALRDILAHYPGLQSEVVTFLGDRISESLTGETAQVAVKVFGDDLDTLDTAADSDRRGPGQDPGIVDLQFKRQSGTPDDRDCN